MDGGRSADATAAVLKVSPGARGSMIKDWYERVLFASRYLLTPLYLALACCLIALVAKSGVHLYDLVYRLSDLSDERVLLSVLAVVDMTLSASLVVIVFLSGYANFVAPVEMRPDDGRPHWIAEIDFGELKLKLMASIVAISAIKLLEGFMDIAHESDRELGWLVGIHLTFVVSACLLALADRLGHRTRTTPDRGTEGV
jgi:uncharacterized protein (TIGR00645 family)